MLLACITGARNQRIFQEIFVHDLYNNLDLRCILIDPFKGYSVQCKQNFKYFLVCGIHNFKFSKYNIMPRMMFSNSASNVRRRESERRTKIEIIGVTQSFHCFVVYYPGSINIFLANLLSALLCCMNESCFS